MKYLLALLLLTAPAVADELKLKSGKTVEWTDLHDAGDSYEVTTPAGTKLNVKKDDVEGLVPKKAAEVLTGATFSFDKKKKLETVDLISVIDVKRDGITGDWKKPNSTLIGISDGIKPSRIEIPYAPVPEEYDLTIIAERKEGDDGLYIGLIGGGKQLVVAFDAIRSSWTGFEGVQGTERVAGGFLTNGKPRTIICMIRREGIVVQADGKDFITWKANWDQVKLDAANGVHRKDVLFLGVGSKLIIHKAVLTAPKK